MPTVEEQRAASRPRRCHRHPAAASVATCEECGRGVCLSCATPVRGRVIGLECLAAVLEDAPPPQEATAPSPRGAVVAVAGFAVAALLTVPPWSRFGEWSGPFGAWSPHWSLVAGVAALAGAALGVVALRRPLAAHLEIAALGGLAMVAAGGALLHYRYPPPLSRASVVPLLAALAGLVALAGVLVRAASFYATGWSEP